MSSYEALRNDPVPDILCRKVYGSMAFNVTQLMKACGNALPRPPVVRSSTNQLFIRMRSDGSVEGRGFKATYKTGQLSWGEWS